MSKTIEELRADAQRIKNETGEGKNTATRVGGLFEDIVDIIDDYHGDGSRPEPEPEEGNAVLYEPQNASDYEKVAALNNLHGKAYNAAKKSGLGKVYLDKNNGVLTQAMMSAANTCYVIMYDFDLDGEEIRVPSNSVLEFDGGSLSNGTLKGYMTEIVAHNTSIFSGITIEGSWNVPTIYSTWFKDAPEENGLKNVINLANQTIHNNIEIGSSHYYVSVSENGETALSIPSNTDVVIKGKVEILPNGFTNYYIFGIYGDNISLSGGEIIGEKDYHEGVEGEWGFGILIQNANNVKISNINIHDCWGDPLQLEGTNVEISNFTFHDSRRQGISIVGGNNIHISNGRIYNIHGTDPQSGIDIEPYGTRTADNIVIENVDILNCYRGVQINSNESLENVGRVVLRNVNSNSDTSALVLYKTKASVSVENSNFASPSFAMNVSYFEGIVTINNSNISSAEEYAIFVLSNTGKYIFNDCNISLTNNVANKYIIRPSDNMSFVRCIIKGNNKNLLPAWAEWNNILFDGCEIETTFINSCSNSVIRNCQVSGKIYMPIYTKNTVIEKCTAQSIDMGIQSDRLKISDCSFVGQEASVIRGGTLIVVNNSFLCDNQETGTVFSLRRISEYDGKIEIAYNVFNGNGKLATFTGEIDSVYNDRIDIHNNTFNYKKGADQETNPSGLVEIALIGVNLHDNKFFVNTDYDSQLILRLYEGRTLNVYNNVVHLTGSSLKYHFSYNRDYIGKKGVVHRTSGKSADRPYFKKFANCFDIQTEGAEYFDTDLQKMLYWQASDNRWIDSKGFSAAPSKGSTSDRPVEEYVGRTGTQVPSGIGTGIYPGYTFFETTNNTYQIASEISGNTITWQEESVFAGKSIPASVVREGIHSSRPSAEYVYNNLYVGFEYHDTTLGEYQYVESMSRNGAGTEQNPYTYSVVWKSRPHHSGLSRQSDVGFEYFDTDLGMFIYATEIEGTVTWKTSSGSDPDANI